MTGYLVFYMTLVVSCLLKVSRSEEEEIWCHDGLKKIPMIYVDDDYCDCVDGSDEARTSACSHGKFLCEHEGLSPQVIASSRVLDGICDCCDGSDEKGMVTCPNTCHARDRAARQEVEKQKSMMQNALKTKQVYVKQYNEFVQILQKEDLKAVDVQEEIQIMKEEERRLKSKQKDREARGFDIDSILLGELRGSLQLSSLTGKELVDVYSRTMNDLDHDTRDVCETASRHKLPILRRNKKTDTESPREAEAREQLERILVSCAYTGNIIEALDRSVIEFTEKESNLDLQALEDDRHVCIDEDEDEDEDLLEKDSLFRGLNERQIADEIEKREKQMKQLQILESSESSFGPDGAFFGIQGEILELREGEHSYEVRPFDRVGQAEWKKKHKGNSVNLGSFQSFQKNANGLWVMTFTDGASCPNRVKRSAEVRFECGDKNEIVSVTEPQMCFYDLRAKSPAACEEGKDTG